ncbi:MAG: HAD-IIA family hydrolase [SAR324 cluster bacterium]|nr:HAD-IIA family hydrolase [SAR324 cluster bacterium]
MNEDFGDITSFLLDMDGTVYLSDKLFPGVLDFLAALRRTGRGVLFVTNNSSQDGAGYSRKLTGLGIAVEPGGIVTSGAATVDYLNDVARVQRVYALGTASFEEELRAGGLLLDDQQPQAVVLGFDLTLTYDKLRRACHFIRQGVPFIASHPDLTCPTSEGPIPDCGAITALITAATGIAPVVIGKPHRYMVDAALKRLGSTPAQTAIVGDRLYTDMEMGFRSELRTVLVLSGESTEADVAKAARKPDLVVPSIAELIPLIS